MSTNANRQQAFSGNNGSTEVSTGGRTLKIIWIILSVIIILAVCAAIAVPIGLILTKNNSAIASTSSNTSMTNTTATNSTNVTTTTVATTINMTTTVNGTTTIATTSTTTACSYIFTYVASYSYSAPVGIATADINNDGKLDIVETNTGTNDVSVLLGMGNGNFTASGSYSTGSGSYPRAVAFGDFNKDNQLDIVVANYFTGNVAILLGYGTGVFGTATLCTIASNPYAVAVGDVNGDTCPDIAVASQSANSITILLGNCSGAFGGSGTVKTISTGSGSNPQFVAFADFNSDGRLDMAVANHLTDTMGIFLGYSNGTFSAQTTYSTGSGSNPNMLIIADFNLDGKLDVVVVNNFASYSGIFFGYGDGTFMAQTQIATSYFSGAVTSADINNDNKPDLICAHTSVGKIGIALNNGNGTFASEIFTATPGGGPNGIVCGDFNGDGKQDVAITNAAGGATQIFLNPC
ncbi:unnamed protein product [Adineta steineri]|uniref:Uncharacterized protein n=1 Tax=Adineta steineri TaxID=433720 RepID=A0A819IWH7_9BILA|nr:unnamed protein product [Adineta steineri]CAF3920367.1 unnamed protein product [Adineta steineri]